MRILKFFIFLSFLFKGYPIFFLEASWENFCGRTLEDIPIYRSQVSEYWKKKVCPKEIVDTRKPIAEYWIVDENQKIEIVVHNFPFDKPELKIPPLAQIQRWQKQLTHLKEESVTVKEFCRCGFYGYYFKGTGVYKKVPTTILGWSFSLSPIHEKVLYYPPNPSLAGKYRQMAADVTIKATGDPELIRKYQHEIENFAYHFELIDEIPSEL